LSLERIGVYNRRLSPTQPFTKFIPYILKRITFITLRASEMKVRAKEALSINFYSERYSNVQMLKTQLKINKNKETASFSFSYIFSL